MTQPPAKRVWIIGARGFLGAALLELWPHALAIDPRCAGEGIAACAQEPGAMARALEQAGAPELVYLCAATRGGDAAAYRCAYLEPALAVAAAAPGARLVFCSSTAVYEGQGAVVSECSPTPGSTEKLRLLLQAEQAVTARGGVVARLAPLYGRGRCELLRRHLAGEPRLPGAPERMLNYLHVDEAARALYLLGAAPQLSHSVYNVCGESFTKAQAYALLESLTGIPASRETGPPGRRGASNHRVTSRRLGDIYEPQARFAPYVQQYARGNKREA